MHILGIFLNMDSLLLENICPKHLFWALFLQGLHQAESGVFSLRCITRLLWIGSSLLVFAWGKLACRCCIVLMRKLGVDYATRMKSYNPLFRMVVIYFRMVFLLYDIKWALTEEVGQWMACRCDDCKPYWSRV